MWGHLGEIFTQQKKKGTNLNLNPPQVSVPRTFCMQHFGFSSPDRQKSKKEDMQRTRRRKRSCRALRYQQQSCRGGRERGRLRRHWSEACHTFLPLMGWSAPALQARTSPVSSSSILTDTLRHGRHPSFSIFPVIQVRPGQLSLSHRLQPVLMRPLFFFFLLTSSHADRRQQHDDNKPLLYLKKGHFFLSPRLQSRSSASEALTVWYFKEVLNRPEIQQELENEERLSKGSYLNACNIPLGYGRASCTIWI